MTHLLYLLISTVLPIVLLVVVFRFYQRMRQLKLQCKAMLQEKELIYGFVHDVAEVFADADSIELNQMLKRVLFYALRTSRASSGAVYMKGADGETFHAEAISGIFPPLMAGLDIDLSQVSRRAEYINQQVKNRPIRRGDGLIAEVADLGSSILVEDAERESRIPQYSQDFMKVRTVLLIPMRFHQQVLGVLVLVNRLDGMAFCEADLNLVQSLADQATVSIHFLKLREELNKKQRMDHDLNVARRIQSSLLPREIPRVPGVELAAFYHPALKIGGDYYDFFFVDEDRLGIAIADVSGKGISGAIMTTLCRSVLRAQARGKASPAAVLSEVNHIMEEDVAEDMFVTILYMVLNIHTRELTIARAGHERPLLIVRDADKPTIIDSGGAALGLVDEACFDQIINERVITLLPGSVLVAYTDGVTEAMNEHHEEWGVEQMSETVCLASREGAHSVVNNVRERLLRFVGETAQYDDMTMVALRMVE